MSLAIATQKKRSHKSARRHRMTIAWSVWLMSVAFVFFQFYLQLSSGQIVDALMKSFSLTTLGGGLLASTYYYIYVLLQTPAGMLMDRYGPRLILSIGAVVVCAGSLLFAQASVVSLAALGRILMGTGAAFAFVGCLNLIAKWFPMRRFAMMAAIVEAAGMLGAIIGSLWLADFIERIGWRICMVVSAAVAGLLSILLWSVVRNAPRRKMPQVTIRTIDLWLGVKRLMRNRLVWMNGVYSGLMFSIMTTFIALWAIPFLEQSHHVSLFRATLMACSSYVGVIMGGPIFGWLDVRYDCRRLLMVVSALLTSVALFLVIFWISLPVSIVTTLLFVTGIFASAYVLTFAIANEIAIPTNRATSIGLTNMLCVGFAPILQPFIGYLMHAFEEGEPKIARATSLWHFQWAVSVIPMLLLVAMIMAFSLPKRQRGFVKRK